MSAFSNAFSQSEPGRSRSPSTYIVQDGRNEEELMRLAIQDKLLMAAMGGTLTEQAEVKQFKRVLDIGCGTGGWIIETARSYPAMHLTGIDINQAMIDYASAEAGKEGVSGRVKFQIMDALALPGLANASFDLVNQRFGSTYLRTWDWAKIAREMVRVARPGATIRLTESEAVPNSNSEALQQLCEMLLHAFYSSHHFFNTERTGIVPHLKVFLEEQRCQDVQIQLSTIEYQAGTELAAAFYQDVMHMFRTFRPFIQKWNKINKDYDTLYQQMLSDMQRPDFHASVNVAVVWGRTPG